MEYTENPAGYGYSGDEAQPATGGLDENGQNT